MPMVDVGDVLVAKTKNSAYKLRKEEQDYSLASGGERLKQHEGKKVRLEGLRYHASGIGAVPESQVSVGDGLVMKIEGVENQLITSRIQGFDVEKPNKE